MSGTLYILFRGRIYKYILRKPKSQGIVYQNKHICAKGKKESSEFRLFGLDGSLTRKLFLLSQLQINCLIKMRFVFMHRQNDDICF